MIAIVRTLMDTVKNQVNDLRVDNVMSTCEVASNIILSCDQLLWRKELAVCALTHLVNDYSFIAWHLASGWIPSSR